MNPMIPLFVTLSTFVGDKAKRIQKRYTGDDRGASLIEYIALLFIVALIVAAVHGSGIDQIIKTNAVEAVNKVFSNSGKGA
jgi:Flp pilus assembly pilin Flp